MEQKEGYKSISIDFQQQKLGVMLSAKLMHYGSGNDAIWTFHIFDFATKQHVYTGNLEETIELIMLGKLHKETYQNDPIALERT